MNHDTKILRRVRPGRRDSLRSATADRADRRPHEQHQKLLAACRQVGEGTLERIEIADGLPIYWKTTTKAQRA